MDVNKIYIRKDIQLSDGLIYKWDVFSGNDTARYFNAANDVYEATVVFRKKGVPDVVEDVDDRSTQIIYSGTWDKTCCAAGTGHLNNTISWSGTVGSSFVLNFTGKSISWYVEVLNHMGIAGVTFDNEPEQKIDLYSSTRGTQIKIFTKSWVTSGPHKVTVRVTGEKAAAATGFYVVSDYFKIVK